MVINLAHNTNLITSCVKWYQGMLSGSPKTRRGRTEPICRSEKASPRKSNLASSKEAESFTKGSCGRGTVTDKAGH